MSQPVKAVELILKSGDSVKATQYQWWEKSESGKSWNLWEEAPGQLLTHIHRLNSSSVMWVMPIETPAARTA